MASIQNVSSTLTSSEPISPSSSATVIHTVTVGKGSHQFIPDILTASVGDVVKFEFFPLIHSVVRAQYGYPCIPYEDVLEGQEGFFSGLFPVSEIASNPPNWNLTINDTNPVFFYCSAPGSCINYQMVGVINPNSSTSISVQKRLAKHSDYMLQPGEGFPSEASASLSSVIPVSSDWISPSSSTASTGATSPDSLTSGDKLAPATIAGVVIGVIGFLATIVGLVAYFLYRIKAKDRKEPDKSQVGVDSSQTLCNSVPENPYAGPNGSLCVSPCSPQQNFTPDSCIMHELDGDPGNIPGISSNNYT
ncbi:hypothetical protein D6C78_10962 [Aureobasidium pullulans]|uniref:Cupredoxin n=1 Tax=Aureobasidium pullulans TaxID=5580 RepID=A0A4T0BA55_AURPU|nr:hypothetical protein D6C78_10962 [Aureobasidium pullulans]